MIIITIIIIIILLTQDFNPEKYHHLAGIFSQSYLTTGTPVSIVTHYLSVYTKGEVTTPPSSCEGYSEKGYDIRRAYVACPLRGEVTIKLTIFTCHPLINSIIALSIYLYIYLSIYLCFLHQRRCCQNIWC